MIRIRAIIQTILRRNASERAAAAELQSASIGAPAEIPATAQGGKQLFGEGRHARRADPAPVPVGIRKTLGGRHYVIVGTPAEVRGLLRNPPPRNAHIILSGSLVIMADEEEAATTIEQYHRQTDRIVKPLGTLAKRRGQFTLKVWLHEDAVALKRALPRHRFCFALDQYLAWGRAQQNGHFHLITGYSADDTILHIFTFDNGALTAITEKVLAPASHVRFAADYAGLLAAHDRKDYTVVVADPLPPPTGDNFAYLDGEIYGKPISYFIVDQTAEPSFLVRHGISVVLGAASLLAYVGSMALPYNDYSDQTAEFRRLAATIPKQDLAFGSDQLKTMQERRRFLTDERDQDNMVPFLRRLTGALAGGDTLISALALHQVKTRPDDPDLTLSVSMKKSAEPGVTPLAQAKPVLARLSDRTGIDFHLAQNATYQERVAPDGSKTLTFNIEGDLKGKKP